MKKLGPALIVTAAFIGPGTITTASLAGANFGYALVWALVFSVFATFVLQEMASRLGLVTGKGLSEALRETLPTGWRQAAAIILIVSAIGVGNAAYQGGNLTGAALGLSTLVPLDLSHWVLILALCAGVLLFSGKYKIVERALIALVVLMSLVFVSTLFLTGLDFATLFNSVVSPSLPAGAGLSVIALIGTTVVPYNLFLHASTVATQHNPDANLGDELRENRRDSAISISLGGLVTLAVLSCAASAFFVSGTEITGGNIATQLEPLLGEYATVFFATGLFAAGLTSAITAPLAAAYAVCGALNWPIQLNNGRFRAIWLVVLVTGAVFASAGFKPLVAILFAQAANGMLLPVVALFLIWVMNNKTLLGQHANGWMANAFAGLIVLFVTLLSSYKLWSLF